MGETIYNNTRVIWYNIIILNYYMYNYICAHKPSPEKMRRKSGGVTKMKLSSVNCHKKKGKCLGLLPGLTCTPFQPQRYGISMIVPTIFDKNNYTN